MTRAERIEHRAGAQARAGTWSKRVTSVAVSALLTSPSLVIAGCALFRTPSPAPVMPEPLPVEQLAETPVVRVTPAADPLPTTPERLVSLTATNVSVRELLPLLAEAAGVDLVLAPDVEGRVSVQLHQVPAAEALAAVMAQAGLAGPQPPLTVPWVPAVVFYELPVNVNTADALTLQRRFGLSAEAADLIVRSRIERK